MEDFKSFKDEQDEQTRKTTDIEQFSEMELAETELRELKAYVAEELSVGGLIGLFFLERRNQEVKEINKEELLIRGLVEDDGSITEKGQEYLQTEEVKERFKSLLK